MKQTPRLLSRTTIWRRKRDAIEQPVLKLYEHRRLAYLVDIPPEPNIVVHGRKKIDSIEEDNRLKWAAALIQLARENGRGGFGEHQIKVFPRHPNPVGVAMPYPAENVLLNELRSSGLPCSLILVHAAAICRPIPVDNALRQAGKRYVQRIVKPTEKEPKRLLCLSLQAVYQHQLARGRIMAGKIRPVVTGILEEMGLTKRMRSYWTAHNKSRSARELINRLAGNTEPRKRGSSTYILNALSLLNAYPASVEEKRAKLNDAIELFRTYSPEQNCFISVHDEPVSGGDGYEELYRELGE
jgi:hypothetical protein